MQTLTEAAAFTGLIDLAQEQLGGRALVASDEFFAEKENLLKPGRGIFLPDKYTERGKWMDGWESRRKRVPGHDWCIIKLGVPGVIRGVDIDTNHFLGNHPPYASIEACSSNVEIPPNQTVSTAIDWIEILPKSALRPGSQNLFSVSSQERWTHLRLNIYPDGGVARLKVYGEVVPNWNNFKSGEIIDLAAVQHGGRAVACNDMFFGSMEFLLMPGRGQHMGEAWETRRKRLPGYDWAIVKLGAAGDIKKLEIDTAWHIGNYPDMGSVDACYSPDREIDSLTWTQVDWTEILPKVKLEADKQHFFDKELVPFAPATHVRLNIYPDGGVARLRVYGVRAGGL